MMGFPTGVGCLLLRRDRLDALERPWFAGGTITIASVQGDGHYLHDDEAAFEDGTVDYLNLPAVDDRPASTSSASGATRIHDRVTALTALAARRADRAPPRQRRARRARSSGPPTPTARGGTVTFLMHDRDGRPIDDRRVEELANQVGISLRTGCFCNPGAGEIAHHLSAARDDAVVRARRAGVVPRTPRRACSPSTTSSSRPIRISVGVATNFADVYRFMCFLQGFVDRTVDEIGQRRVRVRQLPDRARLGMRTVPTPARGRPTLASTSPGGPAVAG